MSAARTKYDWQHTSSIMAIFANCHRNPKTRREPYLPSDFDPTVERPKRSEKTADLKILKSVFVTTQ